jgi:hypothetical protein
MYDVGMCNMRPVCSTFTQYSSPDTGTWLSIQAATQGVATPCVSHTTSKVLEWHMTLFLANEGTSWRARLTSTTSFGNTCIEEK